MKKAMSRLCRFILVFSLLYISQLLVSHVCPQESGILTYFTVRISIAAEPDANSGANVNPRGATPIKQAKDSRWVIYDRGDKTDWLQVSPSKAKDKQLIIRFNFLRVVGKVIAEVYGADPSADFLEQREIEEAGIYEYIAKSVEKHFVKVYAAAQGNLAQYEFSYALAPLPIPISDVTSTSPSSPTVTPTITPTPSPTPTEVSTATPAPSPTNTPTPPPTPTEVPTATPISIADGVLSKSDFQVIGDKYGVPFNLLRALSIVGSQNGRVLGDYEVRKVVNSEQLKFLIKIARDTGRPISAFKGSSAGAMGYIQFLPATFYYYAQDGSGDGIKDPLDPYDSVATAAYFLAQEIAKKNSIGAALRSYSNNPTFYDKILNLYQRLESEEKS